MELPELPGVPFLFPSSANLSTCKCGLACNLHNFLHHTYNSTCNCVVKPHNFNKLYQRVHVLWIKVKVILVYVKMEYLSITTYDDAVFILVVYSR